MTSTQLHVRVLSRALWRGKEGDPFLGMVGSGGRAFQGSGTDLLYQTVFKTATLLLRVCRGIPIAMRTTGKVFKGSEI